MTVDEHTILASPAGYRAGEAASFIAQLDDLSRRLFEDVADLTPDQLAWQPRTGTNTIGMLLAHIAIVEVFWTQIGLRDEPEHDFEAIIGIGPDDDGMPIAADATPPGKLAGKDLAYFRERVRLGRDYLTATARTLDDAALSGTVTRKRRTGASHRFDRRWVLYHLVEHFAGHYGQILLLRHLVRAQ